MGPTTEQGEVVDREHSCEFSIFEFSDQIERKTGKGFDMDDRGADEIRRSLDQVCDGPLVADCENTGYRRSRYFQPPGTISWISHRDGSQFHLLCQAIQHLNLSAASLGRGWK
jgi:hypothetical protein